MLLEGKNVVVSGCLRGIGRATMEVLARNGANVWACCEREDEEFARSVEQLQQECGAWIKPVYIDFLDSDQVKKGVKTIRAEKVPVDALVNIAGINQDALFHMVTMEQMKTIFEINFFSQILFTQYLTKLMLRQKAGSVVMVSSISAIDGNPGQLSYAASKAALIGAIKTLSAELAGDGIRVNAIAPGVIETDMIKTISDDAMKGFLDRSGLKRLGLPEEVANTILFLVSDLSSYVTGQVLRIDGGIA